MAIKAPQIDIDVNSTPFDEFKRAFEKYAKTLDKLPGTWNEIGRSAGTAKTNFESTANSMKVIGASFAAINTHGKEFYQVTLSTARHWKDLYLSTKNVAVHIKDATESLLKWTGIIGILTGGAGLFGFDRLAHSVSSQRQAALGTGGVYGARAAFLTNFRRFGDPEEMLARAAAAKTDIRQRRAFKILGLSDEDLEGDPSEIQIKALRAAARIASEDKRIGRPVGSDPRLEAYDTATRIRLRDQPEEVEEQIAKMRADAASGKFDPNYQSAQRRRFGHPVDVQKKYQDFTTRMERAGQQIETVFVKGLANLAEPLKELSDSVVKLVEKFSDKALPTLVKDFGDAIEWLAKEIEKPSFTGKIEGIVSIIGTLAVSFGGLLSGIAKFARWLGVAPAAASTYPGAASGLHSSVGAGLGGETSLGAPGLRTGSGGKRGFASRAFSSSDAETKFGGRTGSINAAMAAARDQLRSEGVPEENIDAAAEALVGNALAESGLDPTKPHDKGTGYGIYGARLDRVPRMLAWLKSHGFARDSLEGQQRYMAHEAMTDPKYARTRQALMHATNALTAGDVVEENFEVPQVLNNRHGAIRKVHAAAKVSIHPVAGGNTGLSSAAAAAGSP
jgi:hypothetical protein